MNKPEEQIAFIRAVLALGDGFNRYGNLWESIWWRTDGKYGPVTFMVNCNDLFAWACADCEALACKADVDGLIQAVSDVREALGVERGAFPRFPHEATPEAKVEHDRQWNQHYDAGGTGAQLWCARKRGMRPQRPWFKDWSPKVLDLFLACGPERDRKDEG